MYKFNRLFTPLLLLFFTGVTSAQEQAAEGPNFSPVEIYACNFNKGKNQADLDKVIVSWNKWMDETGKEPYSAWIYTADYGSPDYAFDIAWLGAWPNGNVMGRLSDTYMKSGGAIAKDFAGVMTCAAHTNFASMQVRDGISEAGKNAVLQFSDCKLGEGSTMSASVEAIGKMNAYQSEQGSAASQWLFFPAFGGEVDYDFKMVTAHTNYASLGADYERYLNGRGFMKAAEIIGDKFDCGTTRVYRSTMVRSGAPE
ncbi:MAG: hypothetical protein ACJA2E_001906 [Arenicella sp.]|jgi:hypothetical protein